MCNKDLSQHSSPADTRLVMRVICWTARHSATDQAGLSCGASILLLPTLLLVSLPKLPALMGTLFLGQGKYKEPGFPLALQINSVVVGQGANTNNRSSVTHVLFRKGERLSRMRSGKCPGCWVKAREKKTCYNPYSPHCCPEDCE